MGIYVTAKTKESCDTLKTGRISLYKFRQNIYIGPFVCPFVYLGSHLLKAHFQSFALKNILPVLHAHVGGEWADRA